MKRKAFKKVLAVVLVGAMAAGITVSASAADTYFDAPTSEMEVDPSYGTAAVHRAASVLPEILGLSTISGFSTINGGMPTNLEAAQGTLMLGAFGTNMNDNPDPFYYNLFYNFWAAENGAELSQHAMLNDNNVSASPGGADTTVIDGYGTSISLAGRPDMLIGCSGNGSDIGGYDSMIEDIRSGAIGAEYYQEGDENYNPYLVAYTFNYTYDMVVVANTVAHIMDTSMAEDGKYGRYSIQVLGENGKTAIQIAEELGDYVNGISLYVMEEIANNPNVTKKTSAVISSIDATAGTITLANADSQSATSNNRIAEYCDIVTDNIANTSLGTSVTVPEMMDNADAIVFSGGNLTTLVQAIQAYDSDHGTNYEDQLDDKVIIQNYPNSVYGITMNSIENCMGMGYFVGYLYCDVLPEINPVYMTAYFYQNFYHVSDLANVQNILNVTCQDVALPTGVTTDLTNYDADAVYNALQTGKDYYYENFDEFFSSGWGEQLAEVWQEDRDEGIKLGAEGEAWKHFDPQQELTAEVAAAKDLMDSLDEADYTSGSWKALESAYSAAAAISGVASATETDTYNALVNLRDAEDGLVYIADLKDAVADAEALNKNSYSADSWTAVEQALAVAQAVVADADATQDEVDDALDGLEDAVAALKPASGGPNGVAKGPDGRWGYYINGELQKNYNGVAPVKNDYGWWYINNGYVDFNANTVAKNQYGWWYVTGGKVQLGFTGLANYKNSNGWWYIKNGAVDFTHNGVDKNVNGWFYVTNGKVNFDFTGLANYKNSNGWWYISKGAVNFNANTVAKNNNGWFLVENGKVNSNYTGVANYKNANGWWYVKGGKVDFSYNGRGTNKYGTWNVRNGKVVF